MAIKFFLMHFIMSIINHKHRCLLTKKILKLVLIFSCAWLFLAFITIIMLIIAIVASSHGPYPIYESIASIMYFVSIINSFIFWLALVLSAISVYYTFLNRKKIPCSTFSIIFFSIFLIYGSIDKWGGYYFNYTFHLAFGIITPSRLLFIVKCSGSNEETPECSDKKIQLRDYL